MITASESLPAVKAKLLGNAAVQKTLSMTLPGPRLEPRLPRAMWSSIKECGEPPCGWLFVFPSWKNELALGLDCAHANDPVKFAGMLFPVNPLEELTLYAVLEELRHVALIVDLNRYRVGEPPHDI